MDHSTHTHDAVALVNTRQLDDLLVLAQRALDRIDPYDPLALALRGAIAETRISAILEPHA